MTLDEMEETAREWMFYSSHFGLVCEIVNGRWPSERLTDFARVVLAVAPVVRAAEALSKTAPNSHSREAIACRADLDAAIDLMRSMLEGRG